MSMLGANAVERPGSWQRDGDAMHVDEQFDGSSNRIRQGLAFPSLFGHCVPLSWTKLMTRTAGLLLFALCLLIIQGSFWRADSAKEIADQEATISALQLQTKQLEEGRADLAGQLADWEAKYESQKMRNAKLEEELQAMSTRLEAANATRLEGEIKIRKFVRKIKQLTRAESSDPPRLKSLSELPEVQQAMQDLIGKANSSLRPFVPRWIPAEPPSVWQQHTFKAHGMRSFIQFSAYRTGRRTFSGTGLAGAAHRTTRQLQGCTWHATNGSTTAGTLTAAYEGPLSESAIFGQWYEGIVLLCVLEGDTADTGGWLEGSVDFERFVMYREDANQVDFASTHEFFDSPFGKNLNVLTEVRHHHFRGLGADRVETQICTDLVKDDFNRTTHVFNDHLLPLFRLVKRCPLGSPKDCVERAWKEEAASRNR